MPWKQIRHDVFLMLLGYAGCFVLEHDKVPEPFAFALFALPILLGIALEKYASSDRLISRCEMPKPGISSTAIAQK